MVRALSVREARPEDLPVLLDLWGELRQVSPRRTGRPATPEAVDAVAARYSAAMSDNSCRLVVADVGSDVVGMALLSQGSAGTLLDLPAVEMSHVCVAGSYRGRGAGKALVAAAAAYAEETGRDQVVVGVYPQHRDANRFYARLGFGPLVVRRVAPVSALRRRLTAAGDDPGLLRREIRLPRVRRARERAAGLGRDGTRGDRT